jgi:two-component system, NarL family, nitrate/nitrite response regulator NarL
MRPWSVRPPEFGVTVKFHVNAILEKLDADSRTQAVVTAVRRGLLWL